MLIPLYFTAAKEDRRGGGEPKEGLPKEQYPARPLRERGGDDVREEGRALAAEGTREQRRGRRKSLRTRRVQAHRQREERRYKRIN